MLKFITTYPSAALLSGLLACGAAFTAAATGVSLSATALQVSVLLLLGAALVKASASVAGEGTRALAPCVVRVGRPAGSALRRAAISACTHQGRGDIVSLRRTSIFPRLRVGR